MVICDSCKTSYPPMKGFESFKQAIGCSATVHGDLLCGHYGSKTIDLQLWKFSDRPEWVQDGLICDICITDLIDKGNMLCIDKSYW